MGSDHDMTSWKERIREAAQRDAERRKALSEAGRTSEASASNGDPLAAVKREAAIAAHEKAQADAMEEHLLTCGVGALESERLRKGLSGTWEACRTAREWWATPGSLVLLMMGATGTGKTLAAAERIAAIRMGYVDSELGNVWCWPSTLSERGLYVLAGDLATNSYYDVEAQKQKMRLLGAKLLVVDELGTEVMSAPWLALLDNVVDGRMRQKRRTILLSNLDAATFKGRYGERIAGRIRREGMAVSLGAVTLAKPRPPPEDVRAKAGGGES